MSVQRHGSQAEGHHLRTLVPADLAGLPAQGCGIVLDHPTWARAAMSAWGLCGVGCLCRGVVMGFVLVSPALYVPRAHPLSVGANADAAAVLAVVDDGCGRRLVQSLAARLVGRRSIVAIDAAASPGHPAGPSPLTPSPEWLDACGFHPLDATPLRYRLELDATRTWLPDMGELLRRLGDIVRPVVPPEPVSYTHLTLPTSDLV